MEPSREGFLTTNETRGGVKFRLFFSLRVVLHKTLPLHIMEDVKKINSTNEQTCKSWLVSP